MHCNEDISKPTKTPQAVIHAWRRHLSLVGATTSQRKSSVFIKAMANHCETLGKLSLPRENSTAFFLMTLCLWFSYILINLVRVNYLLVQAVFLSLVLMTDKNLVIGLLRILPRKLCNVMIWVRRGTSIFNVKKRGMVTVLLSCFFLWCRRPVTLIKTSNYY